MSAAPVQLTPGAVAVVLGVLAVGFVAWRGSTLAGQALDAAGAAVKDAAARVWYGPQSAPQDYADAVAATLADTDYNPFTNNPNNVSPAALIPAGYKLNQWGGFELVDPFIPGIVEAEQTAWYSNTGGASASW